MNLDYLNATFELAASVFGWISVVKLVRAKQVQGVFAPAFILSSVWAVTAVAYYLSHLDYWSAVFCSTRAAAYLVWSALWLHFRAQPQQTKLVLISSRVRSRPD